MERSEDIHPISDWQGEAAELLAQVNRTHRPVILTENGTARAVLQDPQSYEQMRRALGWLQLIAQAEAELQAGQSLSATEVFAQLRAQLAAQRT